MSNKKKKSIIISKEKKNIIFVIILFVAIIIAILFWKTENIGTQLQDAQIRIIGLNNQVQNKIVEIDSLHSEKKIVDDQYKSLRKNYMNLQRLIVQKRNNLPNIDENTSREELVLLLDQLNRQIMEYEESFEQLSETTDAAKLSDAEVQELLMKNDQLKAELERERQFALQNKNACVETNNLLKQQKAILQRRINNLKQELEKIKSGTVTDTDYVAKLKEEIEKENKRYNELKDESDSIIAEQNQEITNLEEQSEAIENITKSSFNAYYNYKEGRRKEIKAELNTVDLHKSRFVRTINIDFLINTIDEDDMPKAIVTLYKKTEKDFEPYRFNEIEIPVKNLKGEHRFNIDPKLDKGTYKFVVTYQAEEIYSYPFDIN